MPDWHHFIAQKTYLALVLKTIADSTFSYGTIVRYFGVHSPHTVGFQI